LNSCILELKILKLRKTFIHRYIIWIPSRIKKYCKFTMHKYKHVMTRYISKILGPSSSIIFKTYRIQSQRYKLVLCYRILTLDSCPVAYIGNASKKFKLASPLRQQLFFVYVATTSQQFKLSSHLR
jgi:hypothetical protein